jgi:hypothetical protein
MWERVLERFFGAVSDATFWVIIIVVISMAIVYIIRGGSDVFLEDVDKLKEARAKNKEE